MYSQTAWANWWRIMTRALPGVRRKAHLRHTRGPETNKTPEILRVLSVEARGIEVREATSALEV